MGLGGMKTAWQRQTKDFAHTKGDTYTSLIFDNRGMGESGKPLMRYSTSSMAQDTIELLDHLEWTSARSIHVIGISMGGMIAQELVRHAEPHDSKHYTDSAQGLRIPERIASLSLVSTAAYLYNTVVSPRTALALGPFSKLTTVLSGLLRKPAQSCEPLVGLSTYTSTFALPPFRPFPSPFPSY